MSCANKRASRPTSRARPPRVLSACDRPDGSRTTARVRKPRDAEASSPPPKLEPQASPPEGCEEGRGEAPPTPDAPTNYMSRVGGEGGLWAGEGGHVRRHPRDSGPDTVERPRLAPSLALSGIEGARIRGGALEGNYNPVSLSKIKT